MSVCCETAAARCAICGLFALGFSGAIIISSISVIYCNTFTALVALCNVRNKVFAAIVWFKVE